MSEHLLNTVKQFGHVKQHALVIGDVMLDRYLIGDVARISPEAPVPIVLIKSEEVRAGGAANVAANLALLGIPTHLVGCVGNDADAKALAQLSKKSGIKAHLITSKLRPTVTKTRVLGGHQQMVRLDKEDNAHFSAEEENALWKGIQSEIAKNPGIVLLSDYAKGDRKSVV